MEALSSAALCFPTSKNSVLSICSHQINSDPGSDPRSLSSWEKILRNKAIRVSKAEARPLNVPLLAPFTIASTKLETVQNVAIRVELADGSVGWGEAPTLPPVTAEDQPTALAKALEGCSFIMNRSPNHAMELLDDIGRKLPGHQFASVRAGIEMALVDAVAHSLDMALWQLFGANGSSVTTDITIPICEPNEAAALALSYAQRGFLTLKTKVGGRGIESDIAMLQAIRSSHPNCSLILDANGGYNANEALQVLEQLCGSGLNPVLLEQPVQRNDWVGLGHVTRKARELYGVAVAADESCRSLDDAKLIISEGLAEIINIKLSKLGVMGSLDVISLAHDAGIGLMIGGMVETRLAMGFAANFCAGLGVFRFVDLDTPLLLCEDPVHDGYRVEGATYHLNNVKGHGGWLTWD